MKILLVLLFIGISFSTQIFAQEHYDIPEIEKQALASRMIGNCELLWESIAFIANKKQDHHNKKKKVSDVLKLFFNPNENTIGVTGLRKVCSHSHTRNCSPKSACYRVKQAFPKTKKYFEKLLILSYDEVVITQLGFTVVSDLKQNLDGGYTGAIAVRQSFKAYRDKTLVIDDLDTKIIQIRISVRRKEDGAYDFSILFGDITVDVGQSILENYDN